MMMTYIAMVPIEHDGTRYEIGQDVILSEATAKPLLDCGAVVEPANTSKEGSTE